MPNDPPKGSKSSAAWFSLRFASFSMLCCAFSLLAMFFPPHIYGGSSFSKRHRRREEQEHTTPHTTSHTTHQTHHIPHTTHHKLHTFWLLRRSPIGGETKARREACFTDGMVCFACSGDVSHRGGNLLGRRLPNLRPPGGFRPPSVRRYGAFCLLRRRLPSGRKPARQTAPIGEKT